MRQRRDEKTNHGKHEHTFSQSFSVYLEHLCHFANPHLVPDVESVAVAVAVDAAVRQAVAEQAVADTAVAEAVAELVAAGTAAAVVAADSTEFR